MKSTQSFLLAATLTAFLFAPHSSTARSLEETLASHLGGGSELTWLAYRVPAVEAGGKICCGRRESRGACRLESRGWSVTHDRSRSFGQPDAIVYLRFSKRTLDRIRVFSETCQVDNEGANVVELDGISPEASLAYLEQQAFADSSASDEALAALALHDVAGVEEVLERLALRGDGSDLRDEAVFWLGELRGEAGLGSLEAILAAGVDADLREEIAFALSESPAAGAQEALVGLARRDPSSDVRGRALFWLGQRGGEEAEQMLLEAIRDDRYGEVRDEAIFAVSELPDGRGVDLLLEIVRADDLPREARQEAIFWLGQSDDPRVWALFEGLFEK